MREFIEKAIEKILEDYEKNKKKYTTEGDIICNLFAKLCDISWGENIIVHSQVRPFRGEIGREEVIRNGEWNEPKNKKANSGSVIDLAIIDMSKDYWNKSIKKANIDQIGSVRQDTNFLKYWRILSYPVEALRAAIEVKAKVRGNRDRIWKDIGKLIKIKEGNPDCLTYMIIADRRASSDRIQKIIENFGDKKIDKIYTYPRIK